MSHPAEVHVTLIGNLASGPEFAVCGNGAPRAAFRPAVPERRFDRETAAWITSRIGYYSVICRRTLAEHVGSSLGRGDPVVVTGRQRIVEGSAVEVDAVTVGHDLRYGLSSFRAVARRRGPSDAARSAGPIRSPRPPRARSSADHRPRIRSRAPRRVRAPPLRRLSCTHGGVHLHPAQGP